MNCQKCGKRMNMRGMRIPLPGKRIRANFIYPLSQEEIEYRNEQLGKYSDDAGECDVAICYECYIDKEFGIDPNLDEFVRRVEEFMVSKCGVEVIVPTGELKD